MADLRSAGFAWELEDDVNIDAFEDAPPVAATGKHVAGNSHRKYRCPSCPNEYGQKKTLNRHFESTHLGTIFRCGHPNCSKAFSRRDYRTRHEAERHDRSSHTVHCTVCDMDLLGRSWDEHCKSNAHLQAERQSDDLMCLALQAWRTPDIIQMPATESLINPLLITSWFFWKLNLGCGPTTWDESNGHFKPSSDVLNLKGLSTRVLLRKLKNYQDHELSHLIRAVEIMTVAEAMISGWENAKPHKNALHYLRTEQILPGKNRQKEMTSQSLTIAIILSDLAGVTPIGNDTMLVPATASGPVMSLTPPAWYYKNVRYSGMTQAIHDPASFTCGLGEEDIKNKWYEIPLNAPTFRHDLSPGPIDTNSLSFCWGSEATAALSGASALIRRNLHAFLCMSTTTAFVPVSEARAQQHEKSQEFQFPRKTSTRGSDEGYYHKQATNITGFRAASRAQQNIEYPYPSILVDLEQKPGPLLQGVGYLSPSAAVRTIRSRQDIFAAIA